MGYNKQQNKMKQRARLRRSISRTDGSRRKNKNAMKTADNGGKVLEWAWRNRYQWSSHLVYKVAVSSWLWCANNNYNNRNGEADRNFEANLRSPAKRVFSRNAEVERPTTTNTNINFIAGRDGLSPAQRTNATKHNLHASCRGQGDATKEIKVWQPFVRGSRNSTAATNANGTVRISSKSKYNDASQRQALLQISKYPEHGGECNIQTTSEVSGLSNDV
jgi:hypothetical protein